MNNEIELKLLKHLQTENAQIRKNVENTTDLLFQLVDKIHALRLKNHELEQKIERMRQQASPN